MEDVLLLRVLPLVRRVFLVLDLCCLLRVASWFLSSRTSFRRAMMEASFSRRRHLLPDSVRDDADRCLCRLCCLWDCCCCDDGSSGGDCVVSSAVALLWDNGCCLVSIVIVLLLLLLSWSIGDVGFKDRCFLGKECSCGLSFIMF